jgi:hypothetical protein
VRRVAVIVAAWLATLAGAVAAYQWLTGDAAVERGRERFLYRATLKQQLEDVVREQPAIVWMGDSTMFGITRIAYPQLVGRAMPGTSWGLIACAGCDFFAYYPVVGELLTRWRPAVLVLVAHLRFFRDPSSDTTRTVTTRNDLLSLIPTKELARAVDLPFDTRGMTVPRLLLARLLRYESFEHALYFVDGARALVSEAEVPWLGPNGFTNTMIRLRAAKNFLAASDVELTPTQATLRMMMATIRLARRHGVRVVVVGSPIPPVTIGYDADVYAARFALLRWAVEGTGGVFVDLHDALPAAQVADPAGHFTPEGTQAVAHRVRPVVARALAEAEAPAEP